MGRTFAGLLMVAALFGCRATPTPSPSVPAQALAACDPEDGTVIEFTTSPGGTPEASPELVHAQACRLRVVDVREREELGGALGVIHGAEHVPQRRVAVEALGWDRDEPIVVVCRSGRRSGAVVRELAELGFSHAASMTGGMLAWQQLGLPTVDGASLPPASPPEPVVMREVSREDIVAHVADRDRVRFTKAATLMLHGTQACVDGRDAHAIVGTPGGDAGELVLALAAAEQLTGHAFAAEEIERIFDAYLEAFGHFYMHSDEHAVAALLDALADELPSAELPSVHDPAGAARFVQAPPAWAREAVLAALVEPDHVGCGHLRLMLGNPEEYGARPQLVADVLRAFYRRLWKGHPALELTVLFGTHEESAVITVELATEVHAYTRIPLVSPRLGDTEIFVAHPQVARFVRRENAAFLLEQVPLLQGEGIDEAAFFGQLEELADRQLQATLGHLAPTLPHFRVRFSGDAFEVTGPWSAAGDALTEEQP